MDVIKVEWRDEDIKMMIESLGFEPSEYNLKMVKLCRLEKKMVSAMIIAGWDAMRETILTALQD